MSNEPASRGNFGEGRQLSNIILESVTEVTGTDPSRLPPLYHAVDPDALDRVFASDERTGERLGDGHVTFVYHDCVVTAHADGRVTVEPIDGG
ncbi:hypothetical protein Hbl1158_07445 [Halobaculum sp. CBA1158]|uniref:HalOD1 output domain-containing protein n=1 Tax=Halobaculum sp. CBA1158 TaxID=2904243 RepID=UPI001F460889|nr:HalOD1 output domain-containing protein [Halobaculum sp. CBA1158]UIP01172.1 hypothetical protein Hbl1158_07445 [Halobaculum sp. CBA1158]